MLPGSVHPHKGQWLTEVPRLQRQEGKLKKGWPTFTRFSQHSQDFANIYKIQLSQWAPSIAVQTRSRAQGRSGPNFLVTVCSEFPR